MKFETPQIHYPVHVQVQKIQWNLPPRRLQVRHRGSAVRLAGQGAVSAEDLPDNLVFLY